MGADDFKEVVSDYRSALGDLTNLPVKRGAPDDSVLNPRNAHDKNADIEEGDAQFAKKVCLEVENLVKEKCKAADGLKDLGLLYDSESSGSSPTRDATDRLQVLRASVDASRPEKAKGRSNLEDVDSRSTKDDGAVHDSAGKDSYASCVEQARLEYAGKVTKIRDNGGGYASCVGQALLEYAGKVTKISDNGGEEPVTRVLSSDARNLRGLARSECMSTNCSNLHISQSSRVFGLDRCTMMDNPESSIAACSCSFCLKASYIWSDLHYQDIKGRISVLKKSQKEAGNLVQMTGRGKQTIPHGQGSSNKTSKLESDLVAQWKSLFLSMQDIFLDENKRLQSNFVALRDMRENCKIDLERAYGATADKT